MFGCHIRGIRSFFPYSAFCRVLSFDRRLAVLLRPVGVVAGYPWTEVREKCVWSLPVIIVCEGMQFLKRAYALVRCWMC